MQPIKFRGKRKDNGEWVYDYLIIRKCDGIMKYYIYDTFYDETEIIECIIELEDLFIEVIPKTVGQFTGLYDKEGKELYHNDIVKTWNGNISYIYYEKGYWRIGKRGRIIKDYEWDTFEKIGNVFDNPELLKKEANNEQRNMA